MDFWLKLFDSGFMPHGHCYQWQPEILWLHAISDGLITLAYAVIPVILASFVRRRKDLAFKGVFLLFGAFILLCGATHALEIWAIWHGTYRLTGVVKALTALVSVGTAGSLVVLFPKALRLPSPSELEIANQKLREETKERLRAEAELARREKEALFQSMVDSSPNGILLVGKDGNIDIANQAAEKIFLYDSDELTNCEINRLIPSQHQERHDQLIEEFFQAPSRRVMAGGRELQALAKDGSLIPVAIWLSPLSWKQETFSLVSIVDISERNRQEKLLEDATRRFDRAVAGAMDGLWEWQVETNAVWMSDQFFRILGYDPAQEKASFSFWEDRIHPEDKEEVMAILQAHLDHQTPYITEHRLLCGDGEYRWILSRGDTTFEASGDRFLSGSISIIQARKDTEQELAEKSTFLDTIYKGTEHGLFVIDVRDDEFYFSAFNPAEERLTGISFEEVSGKRPVDLVPHIFSEEIAQQVETNYRRCVAERRSIKYTEMLPLKGRVTWWITHLQPLINHEDKVYRIIGSASEITSLKLLEQELQEKEEYARKILDHSLNGLYLFNFKQLKNTYINPAYTKITGYTLEDLNAVDTLALFHPDDLASVLAHIEEVKGSNIGTSIKLEYRFKHKDGHWIWCLSNDAVFSEKDGEVQEMIGTFIDITQIKEYAQKLIDSNSELEQFAFIASHDLREPLRKIKSFGDLLVNRFRDDLPERGQLYVNRMTDAAARLDLMINDLLSLSRVNQRFKGELVNLNDTLATVVSDLKERIQETGARLSIGNMPIVEGDTNQLYQLFQNLITNSLKYVNPGEQPRIYVKHVTGPNYDELVVKDFGIGIPENKMDEIFHIFKRLHGKSEYAGNGIGLALCRKIAERHSGRIWAQSNGDEPGVQFVVQLPHKPKEGC